MADRYGRRLVLGLNALAELLFYACIGTIGKPSRTLFRNAIEILSSAALGCTGYQHQIFPTRAYIATGLFQLMGGGGRVVTAIIFAVISDVSSPDSRTKYFWYLEVADFAAQLLAPSMSSMLMVSNIWNAFTAGLVVAVIAFLIVWILPETAPSKLGAPSQEQSSGFVRTAGAGHAPEIDEVDHTLARSVWRHPFAHLKSISLHQSGNKVIKLSFALLTATMARTSLPLLQQFASERLHWTIAQVRTGEKPYQSDHIC